MFIHWLRMRMKACGNLVWTNASNEKPSVVHTMEYIKGTGYDMMKGGGASGTMFVMKNCFAILGIWFMHLEGEEKKWNILSIYHDAWLFQYAWKNILLLIAFPYLLPTQTEICVVWRPFMKHAACKKKLQHFVCQAMEWINVQFIIT